MTGTRTAHHAGRITATAIALVALSALTSDDPLATVTALATGTPLAVLLWRGTIPRPRHPLTPGPSGLNDTGGPSRRAGSGRRRRVTDAGLAVGLAVVASLVLHAYVLRTFTIGSSSMRDTLRPGDHVLAERLSYRLRPVRRGDLVVFPRPGHPDEELVKRVVGLPGERVESRDGAVTVDGVRLLEPYARPGCAPVAATVVPRDHLYVLGDDRCGSLDSRQFGAIDGKVVQSRIFGIVWPLGRTGRF